MTYYGVPYRKARVFEQCVRDGVTEIYGWLYNTMGGSSTTVCIWKVKNRKK